MLHRGVNARGEGVGVSGGDGVGAQQFDLFHQAVLLGLHQGHVFLGLIDAVQPFAQNSQPFFLGIQQPELAGWILPFAGSSLDVGLHGGDLGSAGFNIHRKLLLAFRG